MNWMMFRSEATNDYYVYNGTEVINIMPGPNKLLFVSNDLILDSLDKLQHTKKKLFTYQKIRYIIVCKGQFLTE